MKKVIAAVALSVGLGVAGIASATPAFADEGSYLNDLAQNGYTGDNATYLGLGYGVCNNLDSTQDALVEAMYQSTGDSIDHAEARFIVESAELYLC